MVERPSGITVIAAVDGVTGILAFLLGLLSTGIIPLIDIGASLSQVLPNLNPSIIMAFGVVCVVGAMGLARMSAWGYFMTLLVRFLSIMFFIAYLVLPVHYIALLLIPEIVIVGYLIWMRGLFFEPVISPVMKANEELDIPELPNTLTMPSEQAARVKEIEAVLSTPKPTPRICPQCGEQNPLEAVICSHCGGHLEATPTKTSSKKVRKGTKETMVFCIYCGTKNGDEAEYCFRCGKKMWKT